MSNLRVIRVFSVAFVLAVIAIVNWWLLTQ
jgi:hypothetical protein